jgi:glycosyltransferase involved in cell wall biosynthesis
MGSPKRNSILFIDQYANMGGGQRSLLALIRVARSTGHSVAVLAPAQGLLESGIRGEFGSEVVFRRLPRVDFHKGSKGLGDVVKLLRFTCHVLSALWTECAFPIRYFNGPRAFLAGFLGSFFYRGRSIFHVRIDHSSIEKRLVWLIARFAPNATVVFNSPYLLGAFLNAVGIKDAPENCIVIENSLYPPYSELVFIDRFCDRSGPLKIGVFGRICHDKGQDAMVHLVENCPDVEVLLLGSCDEGDKSFLDDILAKGHGKIAYAGFHEDMVEAVGSLGIQIAIVPSRWNEAFGLVAIESMAMSCLTFVSDRGMLPDIAKKTGADSYESPAKIVRLIAEIIQMPPEARAAKALAQYSSAQRHYGFKRFTAEITTLLKWNHPCAS